VIVFDLREKQTRIAQLEEKAADPGLWQDPSNAQQVLKDLSDLKDEVLPWLELEQQLRNLSDYALLASEEEDSGTFEAEIRDQFQELRHRFEQMSLATLLGGEHDSGNAILEINAGAGGTEACDWAEMLLRMYARWAERQGYKVEMIDQTPGEVAGTKSVTLVISGRNAYGYLKAERGVHRLVRISPFDANKRRHTSFASVDVIPEIEDVAEIQIEEEDLKIETFRSAGAGGQNVQKNETAVRITHLPTGIVVACQNERSQLQNRENAMRVLRARLYERQQQENRAKIAELRGEMRPIEWGSQIRSYVFHPYTMVKDHRTGVETGDVLKVMDGEIDEFIEGYLEWDGAPVK